MAECRSCGAQVTWAKFDGSGKPAPFDQDEAPQAPGEVRWVLGHDFKESGLWASRASDGEAGVTCHFATCPDRDDWRRDE